MESARAFGQSLMALAERLAARNYVVSSLHCDWGDFGSWSLEVQNGHAADVYREALLKQAFDVPGPDVVRFTWDGRDKLLTIQTAPTEPLSSAGPWKLAKIEEFADSKAAIHFTEKYLDGAA